MKQPTRLALALALLLAAAAPGEPTTVKHLAHEDLVRDAEVVFWGDCVSVRPEWNAERTRIATRVVFAPREVLKGPAAERVELLLPGGELDGVAYLLHGIPRFEEGGEVVLYATAAHPRSGVRVPVGLEQGVYRVRRGEGPPRARRDTRGANLVTPGGGHAHGRVHELGLDDLLGAVRGEVGRQAEARRAREGRGPR